MLAITFTNKAVAEMKARVIEYLYGFSQNSTANAHVSMRTELCTLLSYTPDKIQKLSRQVLTRILHSYTAFDIVTIDTFTHRILQTFAHDLQIPLNFQVEMDQDILLYEAVDRIIDQIGENKKITKVLVDFAIDKLNDDRTWNIREDLFDIIKDVQGEIHLDNLRKLQPRTLEDFQTLKQKVYKEREHLLQECQQVAKDLLRWFRDNDLERADFYVYVFDHFTKVANDPLGVTYGAKWQENNASTPFYKKATKDFKKAIIDSHRQYIENALSTIKDKTFRIKLLQNIGRNVTPLSLVQHIQQEVDKIKTERNVLLISEFNARINEAIRDQPVPFIYERLGERYHHYYIDEFQDTSRLQWENMVPLIDNALASETMDGSSGSLTLVGDAKQAIYRWRGGEADQFITLAEGNTPFAIENVAVRNLETNYRSCTEIIDFTNSFFTFLSTHLLDPKIKELYVRGNQQRHSGKEGGCVSMTFVDDKAGDNPDEVYGSRILEIVNNSIEEGFDYKDLCVLVRKNKQGVAVASYLLQYQIPVISSESLLIKNSPKVRFVAHLLHLSLFWFHQEIKVRVLLYIGELLKVPCVADFLQEYINKDVKQLQTYLQKNGIRFSFEIIGKLPLYEAVEYCLDTFSLFTETDAYVQFFIDFVFEFTQSKTGTLRDFLTYWEEKKGALSIATPETINAVRIMTIHRSKGLEFPVVIYPYATDKIFDELRAKTWYALEKEHYSDFDTFYINYSSSEIAQYGEEGEAIKKRRDEALETDAMNMLYVALTRPIEQLHIISNQTLPSTKSKGADRNMTTFTEGFVSFLTYQKRWDENESIYFYGSSQKVSKEKSNPKQSLPERQPMNCSLRSELPVYIVRNKDKIWEQGRQDAIDRGHIIHTILARIKFKEDLKPVAEAVLNNGMLGREVRQDMYDCLSEILNHPKLSPYFDRSSVRILNEQPLLAKGKIYRPDRMIFTSDDQVVLIDYKTGQYSKRHEGQLHTYAAFLQEMNFVCQTKILVYLFPNVILKYV